jgi:hypothetical protein
MPAEHSFPCTRRGNRVPTGVFVLLLAMVGGGATNGVAQTRVSVGAGVGTVRTESGSSFSSATISPVIRFASPSVVVQASGYASSLPNSVWSGQGRLGLWGVTPPVLGPFRLGVDGNIGGTMRSGGRWTRAAHALAEAFWSGTTWGVGVGAGPSAGWIANEPSVVALHTRGRVWFRPGGRAGGTSIQLSVEPTHFFGEWFTDVGTGLTLRKGPVLLSLSADTRLSRFYGSTAAGSGYLQLFVTPLISIEAGGGSYLREPYQGFPRGNFFSLGLRMGSIRPRPVVARQLTPLVSEARGETQVLRFRFRNVSSVAIAGDWDGWKAKPLRPVGNGLWEASVALGRGVYHFNLLVDGKTWVVPRGVATVPDGFGGQVAVLQVP